MGAYKFPPNFFLSSMEREAPPKDSNKKIWQKSRNIVSPDSLNREANNLLLAVKISPASSLFRKLKILHENQPRSTYAI